MTLAKNGIRFIDSGYNEKFRMPDGGRIRIEFADGTSEEMICRYIDEVVREFVASQNPEDEQTNVPSEEQKRESSVRPAWKKKHTQTEDTGNTQSGSGPVQRLRLVLPKRLAGGTHDAGKERDPVHR